MKSSNYILSLILFACCSCERNLDFIDTTVDTGHNITINALAIEGSPLGVYLNRAFPIGKTPVVSILPLETTNYKQTAILDAQVEALVNGQESYLLTLASDSMGYWTDYKPKVGDHIKITATAGDQTLHAETTVPVKPSIEVLGHEITELGNNTFTDTLMTVTCRVTDTGPGNHYYRLRVRSEREAYEYLTVGDEDGNEFEHRTYVFYTLNENFDSEDRIFHYNIERDTTSLNIIPLNPTSSYIIDFRPPFSSTFDDTLFDGGEYTFIINVPKELQIERYSWFNKDYFQSYSTQRDDIDHAYRINPRVMIELEALSPDFFMYLRSIEKNNRTLQTDAEPVKVHYNAHNGFGIFGAMSYCRQYIEF